MRVLFISDPGSVGGATQSLIDVVSTMKLRGHDIIVCNSVNDQLNKRLDELGITCISCGHKSAMNPKSPYKWKRPLKYPVEKLLYYKSLEPAVRRLESSVDMRTVDIIHTNSARNDLGCILYEKYNIPHVMHIREFGEEDFDCCIYRRNYYSYLNSHCDRFIAISEAVRDSWVKKGIDKEKVNVIYNGILINGMKPKGTAISEKLRMVIVGGICETKGQKDCVEALHLIAKNELKNISLDIIGWSDPRYENELKILVDTYGLNENVNFLGARDDVHRLLSNYDLGLMCSKSEGFGRVTAEYMFAGLAVIASNTGANPELVENGVTGLLYNKNNIKELANAILRFYYDRRMLKLCAENGKNKAVSEYTIDKNVEKILNVYAEFVQI